MKSSSSKQAGPFDGAGLTEAGTARGASGRHWAEEALHESEARYRALIDSIDQGFCIIEMLFDDDDRPLDYRFLEVNASFEKQTGLKDPQGKTMRQLEPDHEEHWFEIYGRVAQTGEPARFENVAERLHRWFEVFAFRWGQPESRRVAVLFSDITDRKQAEEARARLAAIVASSDDAIVSKDLNGIIQSWNRGAEKIFGYTAQEAIGQSITLIIPPDRLDEETDILARLRRGERVDHFETVRRHRDGTLLDISLTVSPIVDSHGRVVGASKVARDITERKRAAEAAKKRELEQTLDRQLAEHRRQLGRELHDGLRQELVGIHMLSSRLAKKLADRGAPEAALMQEFSDLIGGANVQVRQLINGLVPVRIDADSLVAALERAAANLQQWYGLECLVIGSDATGLKDAETANHLFHIAQEAMTNAAKHSRASQIEVSIRVSGESLVLEVRDDGVGLPPDFDKRGGMGVTNLRSRAELIGACVSFKGDPGSGTVVSCRLPLE